LGYQEVISDLRDKFFFVRSRQASKPWSPAETASMEPDTWPSPLGRRRKEQIQNTRDLVKRLSVFLQAEETLFQPFLIDRGAKASPSWRQPQADAAPTANPCQLLARGAHCHFEPFQWLARPEGEFFAFSAATNPGETKSASRLASDTSKL
jgi:hypothetical protein